MSRKAIEDIRGTELQAKDGKIGSVDDLYFDDEQWTIRYLVVDTGNWLPGRKVLISPNSLTPEQTRADRIQVELTRAQIEDAPAIDEDPPISRILEMAHANYYGYPYYWGGPYLWGPAALPAVATPPTPVAAEAIAAAERQAQESHVRTAMEIAGYHIQATDGDIGHIEDFAIDDKSWLIEGIIVDTRNWLPGKHVSVAPDAFSDIDWHARTIDIRLTRAELKDAPEVH